MDEYTSELMMGGHNTLVIHNTCEDSLLATPIILDLVILGELCSRIQIKDQKEAPENFVQFKSVLSLLSYFLKAYTYDWQILEHKGVDRNIFKGLDEYWNLLITLKRIKCCF